MSTFGFTPENSDEDSEKNSQDENSGEGLDFAAMMNQVQEAMAEQFQKLGIDPSNLDNLANNPIIQSFGMDFGNTAGLQEALPKNIVRDIAKKFVSAHGSMPIGANDVALVERALAIAELWLDEATFFPSHSAISHSEISSGVESQSHASQSEQSPKSSHDAKTTQNTLSRSDWVDVTLAGWQSTVEPLAIGLTAAMSELLKNATENQSESLVENQMQIPAGAITALLRTFIGSLLATQLGQSIGGLSAAVTGAHDVGLPLLDPIRPALVPQNIDQWSKDLEIPIEEVRIFHALRESAVARLFASNPWLVSYIRTAISEYGKGIRIDIDAIQRQAQEAFDSASASGGFDPANPESFNIALNQGIFTPEETPAQREALIKLETALALIDGWSEEVVTQGAKDRLPNLSALTETLRRRRATSAPAQQLFSSLFGLAVSPRLAREAASFWSKVRELRDIEVRDNIWSLILPTAQDLLTPESYLDSITIPDDLSDL